jgi:hypothetical protein
MSNEERMVMSKKKPDTEMTQDEFVTIVLPTETFTVAVNTTPPVVVTPVVAAQPSKTTTPEVAISFDRWFVLTGRPNRHKAGMQAFTNTKGKKTVAAWRAIFANY